MNMLNLKITKFLFAFLYLYIAIFQMIFRPIPYFSLLLSLAIYFFTFIHLLKNKTTINLKYCFTPEISILILFIVSVFVGGLFFSFNKDLFLSSSVRFVQNFLFGIVLLFICEYDKNIDYIKKLLVLISISITIKTLFRGEGFYNSGRISLTENTNPNFIGVVLILGIFCLMLFFINNSFHKKVLISAAILAMLYTIVLTGSRKVFISIFILLSFWFLVGYLPLLYKKNKISFIFKLLILIFLSLILILLFKQKIMQTLMFQRLLQLPNEMSSGKRIGMYKEAFQFFLKSPIFGIGFNNYRWLSVYNTYSHSTYVEALSCTGLIGTLLYLGAYVVMIKHTLQAYFLSKKRNSEEFTLKILLSLGLILSMLFIGIGSILFYELYSMIFMALIIGQNNLIFQDTVQDSSSFGISL